MIINRVQTSNRVNKKMASNINCQAYHKSENLVNTEFLHFNSKPTPTPTQKLPTKAMPTSQSFNLPTKFKIDAPSRSRAGRNNERDKNTSEGKCNGSIDGGDGDGDDFIDEYECDTAVGDDDGE